MYLNQVLNEGINVVDFKIPDVNLKKFVEYKDDDFEITTVSYVGVKKNFEFRTVHYRGESVIKDKKTGIYHNIRGSLPLMKTENEITGDAFKYRLANKIDGSLLNILYVSKNNRFYNVLEKMTKTRFTTINENGIFIFGHSKRLLTLNEEILDSMETAINSSFNNKDELVSKLPLTSDMICFHFEYVNTVNVNGFLTVKYPESFCAYLCQTNFNDEKKEIKFETFDGCKTITRDFTKKDEANEFINKAEELINLGSMSSLELEGFVVYEMDESDNVISSVKIKNQVYYNSHKMTADSYPLIPDAVKPYLLNTKQLNKYATL